ncbi:preprotein translocase subunit YajC [Mechercharimyces sp. CAU 1602]|uniref:preprotein translocase subunit YajC n=1 Tax=Mechercharimyces sp. CAU 1602 TaxID=2973933 RepID=UPI002161CAD3|nr:preprotein translocase subunit YajC [Mechercharimyces sp. CAU 1602]MCS1350673.1 preprotein translocase subunit YajC [Mechercharimyces sp. CAU 1602]
MDNLGGLLPIVGIIAIFYFLLIRPQRKQQKQRNAMLAALKKGDKVITIGGLHGTIIELTDERATLKVGENQRLLFERSSIHAISDENEEK